MAKQDQTIGFKQTSFYNQLKSGNLIERQFWWNLIYGMSILDPLKIRIMPVVLLTKVLK